MTVCEIIVEQTIRFLEHSIKAQSMDFLKEIRKLFGRKGVKMMKTAGG